MHIFRTAITLIKSYHICLECLGRQFALLSSNMSNSLRAQSILNSLLMEIHQFYLQNPGVEEIEMDGETLHIPILLRLMYLNVNFEPARALLKQLYKNQIDDLKGYRCDICHNLMDQDFIQKLVHEAIIKLRGYEFNHFLAGSVFPPAIKEFEEELRVRLGITTGEIIKTNFNRLFGSMLSNLIGIGVEFQQPDMLIVIKLSDQSHYSIDLQPNPLYIKGRYVKFSRSIPQTHWICRECHGLKIDSATREPCSHCDGKGHMYKTSVEEEICPTILLLTQGSEYKFHGAGREDVNARCLGEGRPFIVEIKNPKNRTLDLALAKDLINESNKVAVSNLQYATRKEMQTYKVDAETRAKSYRALTEIHEPISEQEFLQKLEEAKKQLVGNIIFQRTPLRVVHRRADLVRKKKIINIEGVWLDPVHVVLYVTSQGGTYIKELISGDNNRTSPSFSEIFGIPMICAELDVLAVK